MRAVSVPKKSEVYDKVALVTGGNRGLGAEIVIELCRRGYTTVSGSRSLPSGWMGDGRGRYRRGRVQNIQLDICDEASVVGAVSRIEQECGRLDVLINNAGGVYDTWQTAVTADLDVVKEAINNNLVGTWRVIQECLPMLRKAESARVINVTSTSASLFGLEGEFAIGYPGYRVSKLAINSITRMLAAELKDSSILINAVCPGWVSTEMGGVGGRPIAEGVASVMWAVDLPDDGPSGGLFRDGQVIEW